MHQKTFENKHDPSRPITVKIDNQFISFHFANENDMEFYWLMRDEWRGNIAEHMRNKGWFSDDMENFIDAHLLNRSSTHIAGFHFHIAWDKHGTGVDQHGNRWVNKDNPECLNPHLVDICLDAFNEINNGLKDSNK